MPCSNRELARGGGYFGETVATCAAAGIVFTESVYGAGQILPRHAHEEIDPQFELLHSTPELDRKANAMDGPTRVFWASLTGKWDQAAALIRSGLEKPPFPDTFGVEFRFRFSDAAILRRAGRGGYRG